MGLRTLITLIMLIYFGIIFGGLILYYALYLFGIAFTVSEFVIYLFGPIMILLPSMLRYLELAMKTEDE